jgi:hypothetical protein
MNGEKVEIVSTLLERIPADALDNVYTEKRMKQLLKGVYGVYALFKEGNLYYIGQGDLYQRLLAHYKKDRHKDDKWDTFAFAKLRNPELREELESLLISLTNPPGNRAIPSVKKRDTVTENTIREIINITKKYIKEETDSEKHRNVSRTPQRKLHLNLNWKEAPKAVLRILSQSPKPLTRKEIVDAIGGKYKFTPEDLEELHNGESRWKTTTRWAISGLKYNGMIKSVGKNLYVITDEGRKSLEDLTA